MFARISLLLLSLVTLASVAHADQITTFNFPTTSSVKRFELADTTVPVPPDIQEPLGGLTLVGEPSVSQKGDGIGIVKLQVDAKGRIGMKTDVIKRDGVVGEEIALGEGKYLIQYSGTDAVVDLAKGEHKTIQLAKLTVPKVDGSYKVEVFWDVSNAPQQKLIALLTWLAPEKPLSFHYVTRDCWGHIENSWNEYETLNDLCRYGRLLSGTRKYCAAYRGYDYTAFAGTAVKFNADGTYSNFSQTWSRGAGGSPLSVSHEGFINEGLLEAVKGNDGESFALLPGVYGIKVTNISGKTTTKSGIVVQ